MSAGPQVAVLGAGANGASIGADLTRAGVDVVLIDQWPAHVEAMRANGLRIEMPEETLEVQVRAHHLCEVAELRAPFDVVLIVMKAYDTAWAAHLIAPYVKRGGLVAGVQNGMTAATIADTVGVERAVGCVIEVSSMMTVPGVVERHSPPSRSWFAVGGLDPVSAGRAEEVAALLRHAGSVALVDEILDAKWMKLVSNCTTLVTTAILGLPMLAALNEPGMRELMLRAGQEALDAGLVQGHGIPPIFGLSEEDVADPDRVVEVLLDTLYAGFVLEHTTTTVLHDWLKGRRSEVDELNGVALREARRAGIEAPVNAAVVELAHRIERGELEPGPENLGALLELTGHHAHPQGR